MTIVKELSVVTRTYEKDGQTKKVWKNIGAIHTHEGREYITLDATFNLAALPRKENDDRVFVSMFEPKPKGQQSAPAPAASSSMSDFEGDIPF